MSDRTGPSRKNDASGIDKNLPVSAINNQEKLSPDQDPNEEHNQPDLIKAASAATKGVRRIKSKDVSNLQRDNEELACELRRHALGFSAMATLVDYLANHCRVEGIAECNREIKQQVTDLQSAIEDKSQEIGKNPIQIMLHLLFSCNQKKFNLN